MKKVIKNTTICLLFCIILVASLHILSRIFIPKWLTNDDNMYTWIKLGFYEEEKDSLDLIFIGNSDVYRGISPMELWDNHGIASYAYTSPGQRIWTAYYMLEEALIYQKPKYIVLDTDAVFTTTHSSDGNYRKVFDNMKANKVKMQALTDSIYEFEASDIFSYYFPILRYHDRYKSLTEEDYKYAFYDYHFSYKGLDLIHDIVPYNEGFAYMEDKGETKEIPTKNKEYLEKIIKTCKENNIELILIDVPSAKSWSLAKSNTVKEYAKEKNLVFIDYNLNYEETNFDWKTDTSDGGAHLNTNGAIKITKHIGKYLTENYDFADHRQDKKYEKWHEDSKKYHEALRDEE